MSSSSWLSRRGAPRAALCLIVVVIVAAAAQDESKQCSYRGKVYCCELSGDDCCMLNVGSIVGTIVGALGGCFCAMLLCCACCPGCPLKAALCDGMRAKQPPTSEQSYDAVTLCESEIQMT